MRRYAASISWPSPIEAKYATTTWILLARITQQAITICKAIETSPHKLPTDLTDTKDRYRITNIYSWPEQLAALTDLRRHDGLTHYKIQHIDKYGRVTYLHHASNWPNFVNRQTVANIITPPPDVAADITGLISIVSAGIGRGHLRTTARVVPVLWVLRQPLATLTQHPIMRSIAAMYYRERQHATDK